MSPIIKLTGTMSVYRNKKMAEFVDALPEEEQAVAHKVIQFIRTEFPECEEIIRGELIKELIYEETI